jgi:hypothetical protein
MVKYGKNIMSELDKNQEKLNQLGIELCENHISNAVRQDVHHFGERAIENHLENLGQDELYDDELTEADKDYLERNSLLFMFKAMENLKI